MEVNGVFGSVHIPNDPDQYRIGCGHEAQIAALRAEVERLKGEVERMRGGENLIMQIAHQVADEHKDRLAKLERVVEAARKYSAYDLHILSVNGQALTLVEIELRDALAACQEGQKGE